jgi:hypothetical protein
MMHSKVLRKLNLTLNLPRWSTASIVDGSELNLADTGDELRKKITKFARLRPSLEAIFLPEGVEDEAHLQDLTVGLETDLIDGEPRWPES